MMTEEAKKARAEYMRAWRAKPENQEKQRGYSAKYWERKAKEAEKENDK
ncbi:MAG: hypothetical protein L0L95_08660 [Staphylococcus equorum]|nr:hypothetical protein [Atopostipes suicloacalis]MDN6750310.1 hypothetical protein [Staphylococcus equorum]